MDTSLRILPGEPPPRHETLFRFADTGGVLRAAEKCTGVGQCRKSHLAGGTMCPSYMATRDETHTTRARANVLRQTLAGTPADANPWRRPELAEVMDLCLSCKACKSECPSNVDMARLKAEWQQHWHDAHGVPLRARLVADSAASRGALGLQPAGSNAARLAGGKDGGRLRTRSITAHAAADHTLGVAATAAAARAGPERPRVPVRRRVHRHA
jgi:ferredoxin